MSDQGPPTAATAADVLLAGAHGGRWPEAVLEPADLRDGLATQLAVLERVVAAGDRLRGWKVGLTAGAGRDLMGPGFRPFGYLLDSRTFPGGARIRRADLGVTRIEAELCLVMGARLAGPEVSEEEARAAVAGVAPAFEINEIRFAGPISHPLMVADNLAGWGAVVGDPRPTPAGPLATTRVDVWRNEEAVAAPAPDLGLEDPFLSLRRLVRLLADFGHHLRPGDLVLTGALWYEDVDADGGSYRARFAGLGDVEVAFG